MTAKIKKGDNVVVLSGKDKGKNGKVLKIIKSKTDFRIKAIVEGVNVVKKHTKQSATSKGGIENKELTSLFMQVINSRPQNLKTDKSWYKNIKRW